MLYVSMDLETLGLDPDFCSVIEVGAVVDDLENPRPVEELHRYHAYLTYPHNRLQGEVYAMFMHSKSGMFERIAKREPGYNYLPHDMLGEDMWNWLIATGLFERNSNGNDLRVKIRIAGKNFMAFDMRFLRRLENFEDWIQIEHRALDPAMLYMRPTDNKVPALQTCLDRAKIDKDVNHTAVEDAIDVVRLIRHKLCN